MLLFLNVPLHDEKDAKIGLTCNLENNMNIPMLEVTAGGRAPVPPAESALEKTIQAWFDSYYNESCLALMITELMFVNISAFNCLIKEKNIYSSIYIFSV